MKNKILIFGPIGDFGGREIESGFIAESLSQNYIVDIFSISDLSKKSQVYIFEGINKVYSLKQLLYEVSKKVKFFTNLIYFLKLKKQNKLYYVNSPLIKKIINYETLSEKIIKERIAKYDLIFICAQLSTKHLKLVIEFASKQNIKIIFRTTGTINHIVNQDYLSRVDIFIHHSQKNANNLLRFIPHNYTIIDQCSFVENDLLKIQINKKIVSNFLIVSRLSPEKGVEQVIDFFIEHNSNSTLTIVGEGVLKRYLQNKYLDHSNIRFKNHVHAKIVNQEYNNCDCVIIPSPEETGPLVGIEAMASGKIILSTPVGAMKERLKDSENNFWFKFDDKKSFQKSLNEILNLSETQVLEIGFDLRKNYLNNYSKIKISKQYLEVLKKLQID